MLVEGRTQVEVGALLGVSVRALQLWMTRYRDGGWEALSKKRRGRRAGEQAALTQPQQARLARLVAGACPDQLRIPGLLWTRSAVQALIEREYDVCLEVSTVGRYLKAWGFTLKRPTKRALEQDPVVVGAWLEEVYPALERKAKKEGALILWADESGIRLQELAPRAGYAPKGVPAVARTSGKRATANMISAIANSGQMNFQIFEGRFTADVFIEFLRRLIGQYQERKIYLVVDNHSTHHAKRVRTWLSAEERAKKLELVFLPAYSPELNPDELLNQDVKRHLRTRTDRPKDRPGLVTALRSFLHRRQKQPHIVSAYFRGSCVTYAAA